MGGIFLRNFCIGNFRVVLLSSLSWILNVERVFARVKERIFLLYVFLFWASFLSAQEIRVSIEHLSTTTANLEETTAFYRDLLGFSLVEQKHTPLKTVQMQGAGVTLRLVEVHPSLKSERTLDPLLSHWAFQVKDLEFSQAILKKKKIPYQKKQVPAEAWKPSVTQLFFLDPAGNVLELLEEPSFVNHPFIPQEGNERIPIEKLHHITCAVLEKDLEDSAAFYQEIFSFERLPQPNFESQGIWLKNGECLFHLSPVKTSFLQHKGVWVFKVEEKEALKKTLEKKRLPFSIRSNGEQELVFLNDVSGHFLKVYE